MIELLATTIVIYGTSNGVWSPSHPDLYPLSSTSPNIVRPSIQIIEDRYIPETPLSDNNGNIIIF